MGSDDVLVRTLVGNGCTVAVAESLTGGSLAARLAVLSDASEWFRGGVVAYAEEVKHEVLGVPQVPVVSETAVRAMAEGVAALLGANLALAVTGVGGPGAQDGVPAGTVWVPLRDTRHDAGASACARRLAFEGEPAAIVRQTCDAAFEWLRDHVVGSSP